MKTLSLVQGSPEWHAHRATAFNASDATAMLGISKYKSRSQLLKERATGIVPEVDDSTQRRFNDGHRFEALARPLAEKIIGDTLSPVTGVNGKYSASFDGITFDETVIWEHKSLNDSLRAVECTNDIPEVYCVQMEHQLLVSGAEKCLFSATKWDENDSLVEERHAFYYPQMELRARIVEGWKQFAKDLAAYSPAAEAEKVTATAVIALPALAVQIRGEVTNSNLPVFVSEADKFLAGIKTDLQTDQDFADAESNVKACKAAEDGIEQTKKAITAQATSIDEVMRTMDLYSTKLRDVRLKLDKLVKTEKENRKAAIVQAARMQFNDFVLGLEAETKPIRLTMPIPVFADAIKGLKKLSAMQEAVDTMLRDGKFAAEQVAKDVRAKLSWCKENAAGMSFLFPDLQQIISMELEAFTATITNRIRSHKDAEAAKAAEAIAKIESTAKEKAEREAAAKLAEEEARIRAEERAKAEAESKAKIAAEAKAMEAELVGKPVFGAEQTQRESLGMPNMATGIGRLGSETPSAPHVVQLPSRHSRPTDAEIIEALALNFRVHEGIVIQWLLDMDLNEACERMAKEFA